MGPAPPPADRKRRTLTAEVVAGADRGEDRSVRAVVAHRAPHLTLPPGVGTGPLREFGLFGGARRRGLDPGCSSTTRCTTRS